MRDIVARTRPLNAYSNPDLAIRGAREIDLRLRTVSDDDVTGRRIDRIVWDDLSLVIGLDNGAYINCIVRDWQIDCTLDRSAALKRSQFRRRRPSPASKRESRMATNGASRTISWWHY